MAHDPATGAIPEQFVQIGAQATESLRGDARRLHELAEQFRAQYRADLEDWMQLRARLDRRGGALRPVGTDALRAEYEQRGRELAGLQSRLKRLDVVARQLDLLWGYLDSPDEAVDEPLPMADESPEAPRAAHRSRPGGRAAAHGRGHPRRPGAGPHQRHLPGRVSRPHAHPVRDRCARRDRVPARHAARRAGRAARIHHRSASTRRRRVRRGRAGRSGRADRGTPRHRRRGFARRDRRSARAGRPAHRSFASARRRSRTFASMRLPAASRSVSRGTPS